MHSPQGGICVHVFHDPLVASFMMIMCKYYFVLSGFYVFFSSMCAFYKVILRLQHFLMLSVENGFHCRTRRYILG